MVEECQGYGTTGRGGYLFDLFVCWHRVWAAGLGEVCWEVSDLQLLFDDDRVYVYFKSVRQNTEYFLYMVCI